MNTYARRRNAFYSSISLLTALVVTGALYGGCVSDVATLVEPGAGGAAGGSGGSAPGGSGGGATGGSGGQGGAPVCVEPSDCPGADTTCQQRACTDGVCGVVNAAESTACTEDDGRVCDGDGQCVECVQTTDCPDGVCQDNQCVDPQCTDGIQNGNETDVDCGGTCPACQQGLSRYADDTGLETDYFIVEMISHLQGQDWQNEFVQSIENGGIERVLL